LKKEIQNSQLHCTCSSYISSYCCALSSFLRRRPV